jgi:CBS domain-containing protein
MSSDTVRSVLDYKGVGVCAVQPETPVYSALEIMAEKDIGAVLVVEDGHLSGVLSERDYARKLILHGKASKDTQVREIMSTQPIVVTPAQTVEDCLHLMTEYRVRYLPVVDNGAILGVLSIGDLVNWTLRRQEEEIHHLQHYFVGGYPG